MAPLPLRYRNGTPLPGPQPDLTLARPTSVGVSRSVVTEPSTGSHFNTITFVCPGAIVMPGQFRLIPFWPVGLVSFVTGAPS